MESTQIKDAVKEQYGKVAKGEATCGSLCGCTDNARIGHHFRLFSGRVCDAAGKGESRALLRQSASGRRDEAGETRSTWVAARDLIASGQLARLARPVV